jgi:hypothetical protein
VPSENQKNLLNKVTPRSTMKMNKLVVISSIMLTLAFAGAAQGAPEGAQASSGSNLTSNTDDDVGNVTVQAGRTAQVDVSQNTLTSKWAGFFGTISGARVLGDGSANLYKWTANQFGNSKVIAVPKGNPTPTSLSEVTDPNSFLGTQFNSGIANASRTFNVTETIDPLGNGDVQSKAVYTFNSSQERDPDFATLLYNDGSDRPVYVADAVREKTGFDGSTQVNYQMLVGVGESSDTKSFSFYLNIP